MHTYESWRISFQTSEQAARAAFDAWQKAEKELEAIGAGGVEPLRKAPDHFRNATKMAPAAALPDSLIPTAPDLEYLRSMADGTALPALLRGNIIAALRWIDALQTRLANPCPAQPMQDWINADEKLPGEQGQDSEEVMLFLNGHCALTDFEARNGGGWGIRLGYFDAEKQVFRVHGRPEYHVTHWRALPDSPALAQQPDVNGYTCTVPDDCETLHWRGQILSMNELAAASGAQHATAQAGEEIMVNVTDDDVYMLPLQPSGLTSGPRFVVHVPAAQQAFGQVVKPLTQDQIRQMSQKHDAEDLCRWSYRMGVQDAEKAHGIE